MKQPYCFLTSVCMGVRRHAQGPGVLAAATAARLVLALGRQGPVRCTRQHMAGINAQAEKPHCDTLGRGLQHPGRLCSLAGVASLRSARTGLLSDAVRVCSLRKIGKIAKFAPAKP
jgi:hypothetical protein